MSIARYLARRLGLAGATDLEAAQADEAVDAVSDWIQQQKEAIKPPPPGQKPVMPREFVDVQLQAWLGRWRDFSPPGVENTSPGQDSPGQTLLCSMSWTPWQTG
eukprot:TRINITY_DN13218_c0_g1_i1.p1 TRINITY_DN13218_c0_g1~~TRINITY_DN13218_c0_g1_i1.p1  ORF type:complete len:104 (-),score=34.35 TRINITY_DN13218_c0_g1_i1:179-490(-)